MLRFILVTRRRSVISASQTQRDVSRLVFLNENKLIRTALKTPQSCVSMCCRILHVGRPSTATAQILSFLENRFYTSNRIASQTIAASRCLDGAKYMKNSRDFSFQSGIQKDHKHMQPITGIPNNNEKWASRDIPKHFCSARGWAKACRRGSPLALFLKKRALVEVGACGRDCSSGSSTPKERCCFPSCLKNERGRPG